MAARTGGATASSEPAGRPPYLQAFRARIANAAPAFEMEYRPSRLISPESFPNADISWDTLDRRLGMYDRNPFRRDTNGRHTLAPQPVARPGADLGGPGPRRRATRPIPGTPRRGRVRPP